MVQLAEQRAVVEARVRLSYAELRALYEIGCGVRNSDLGIGLSPPAQTPSRRATERNQHCIVGTFDELVQEIENRQAALRRRLGPHWVPAVGKYLEAALEPLHRGREEFSRPERFLAPPSMKMYLNRVTLVGWLQWVRDYPLKFSDIQELALALQVTTPGSLRKQFQRAQRQLDRLRSLTLLPTSLRT